MNSDRIQAAAPEVSKRVQKLCFQCHGEGSNGHTALSLHCGGSSSRVCPASFFGCWNQWQVPQDFKLQWITVPFQFWITKKTTSVWRNYPKALFRVPRSHLMKAMGLHQPSEKRHQLTAKIASMDSCLPLPSPGCMMKSAACLQTIKCFSFRFGYKQGFLISVIQYQELH